MGVLKLGAVDLNASAGIAEERLGQSLDDTRLARTRRSQEQKISNRTPRRVQAGQKHLIDLYDLFDRLVLSDDFAPYGAVKLPGVVASTIWIEHSGEVRSHKGRVAPLNNRAKSLPGTTGFMFLSTRETKIVTR
jgi:hypothetical protein